MRPKLIIRPFHNPVVPVKFGLTLVSDKRGGQKAAPAIPSCGAYEDGILSASLTVCGAPAPGSGSKAAGDNALTVDAGHHIAVTGEQGLGRTHLGADWQLAFCNTVSAVFREFRI